MEVIDIVSKANRSMTPFLDLRDGEVTLATASLAGASVPTTASLQCYVRPREDRDGQSPESTHTAYRKRIQWVIWRSSR